MTVLVAEDHPVNMKIIRFMLEKEGCEVHSAENGLEAVDLFKTLNPDLIIMDIQMPELDGLDACREIRRIEKETERGRTPISALSANAAAEDREEAHNAGMDHFLSKPVTLDDITGLLGKVKDVHSQEITTETPEEAFGYDRLIETFAGNKEIVHTLLREFLSGIPEMLERIDRFRSEEDFQSLENTAHTMKGQLLNLHAARASESFALLERAAREADREQMNLYQDKCNDALVNVIEEIRRYL